MKNATQTVGKPLRGFGARSRVLTLVAAAAAAMAPLTASAQGSGNAGVAEIVDAIEGLAPDIGTVILAAIGIAVIGIGATLALNLGKRLMK